MQEPDAENEQRRENEGEAAAVYRKSQRAPTHRVRLHVGGIGGFEFGVTIFGIGEGFGLLPRPEREGPAAAAGDILNFRTRAVGLVTGVMVQIPGNHGGDAVAVPAILRKPEKLVENSR